ncbi:hypothetical protein HWI79_1238 [Cryptosporidium felis]|nr:hypothetical protein HWI79_1238 [Cryptosporidium felis]
MQVGSLKRNEKSLSLKEVYGEKLGSFLEEKERHYNGWNHSESPEKLWKALQIEKERFLQQLVMSGLRFSKEVQEVDWRDMSELLEKSELSAEYPFSLPFGVGSTHSKNQFSPKWGSAAGKSNPFRMSLERRKLSEKPGASLFEMDERQWQLAAYEVVLLCTEFVRRNIGELKLKLTRLEESKMNRTHLEELQKSTPGPLKRGSSSFQGRISNDDRQESAHFSKMYSSEVYGENLHSRLNIDYENLVSIHSSLLMFAEMARLKFGISHSTHYMISKLLAKCGTAGMGFFNTEEIHPLDTRYRVLLLLESWNKADLQSSHGSPWDHGKLRIRPGGAPRVATELTSSSSLKCDLEFKAWVNRQIHLIYSNLAFKLQRLVLFVPPGWLQYLPGEIDLCNMLELRSFSWSNGGRFGQANQKELLLEGIERNLGKNPQLLLEFILESISILDRLRVLFEGGSWGDLNYLKTRDQLENGKTSLQRLLKLMSAIERLDLAVRRDISETSLKSVSSTFFINLSSYCLDYTKKELNRPSISGSQHFSEDHVYTAANRPTLGYATRTDNPKAHQGHINRRQLIYSNEFIRESIEEKLLVLPKLSPYWMFESQILHVLIRALMSVNVVSLESSVVAASSGLASIGLHQYSPFISRCVLFVGYMLENGIFSTQEPDFLRKVALTRTGVPPTSLETYSLYLASSIWNCYENYLSLKAVPTPTSGRPLKEVQDNPTTQDMYFSILELILRDLPSFLKHQTIASLEQDLGSKELSSVEEVLNSRSGSKELLSKPSGSNVRARLHSNSRELLRKITSRELRGGGSKEKANPKEERLDELDEDLIHLGRFCKIQGFLVRERKSLNILSQPILKRSEVFWNNPDWTISFGSSTSSGNIPRDDKTHSQLWRIFGISLTTSSRTERVYSDILTRRLGTLEFRSRILRLCQGFFRLGVPGTLRKLLQILGRINSSVVLEDHDSLSGLAKRPSIGHIGSDKRLWTRYCNYCILRSNELRIRELFDVPIQMLGLPATHYVELKLRIKSRDLIDNEEKERMERLARQEIQGCLETFILAFNNLESLYISETVTEWSRVMYEGSSLTSGGGSVGLIRDYVLIIVRLLEVYVPYYLERLMTSEYWDLLMIPKSQFEELVSAIITIDKYMLILRSWLDFNLDSIKIQSRIIDSQMIFNQSGDGLGSTSDSQAEAKLQEMMRRRYINDFQQMTLLSLFSPQFILLIQNRINNIEFLVYKVYQSNKALGTGEWTKGINVPNIYTSSILIDIGTIVNTGIESLLEWLSFPLEDEQSLTLCLSPIMKFFRDITTFLVNTIKKELGCQKYEWVSSYLQYISEILLVLFKNGVGTANSASITSSVNHELRNLSKAHNISGLAKQVLSAAAATTNNSSTNSNTSFLVPGSFHPGGAFPEEGLAQALLTEKFEKGSLFFALLSLCFKEEARGGGASDREEAQRLKFLVSIHNICFFKSILQETSSKFFELFFGSDGLEDEQGEGRKIDENSSTAFSLNGRPLRDLEKSKTSLPRRTIPPFGQYKLPDSVLERMRRTLEFLRSYGAMDDNENKLLASETNLELNSLLFSQSTSIFTDSQALNRHKSLFSNLISDCMKSIDSMASYIFRMYCIRTVTSTFGVEFFLRIYGESGVENGNNSLQNTLPQGSYTSSIEDSTLSLESLLPGLNSHFRDFLEQCPTGAEGVTFGTNGSIGQEQNGGPGAARITNQVTLEVLEPLDTLEGLAQEFNQVCISSLTQLWFSHVFELSLRKSWRTLSDFYSQLEYDFELLDELRRSSYAGSDLICGGDNRFRLSDAILYFLTQLLPNGKLLHSKTIRELVFISNLGSEDSEGMGNSLNSSRDGISQQYQKMENLNKDSSKSSFLSLKGFSGSLDYSAISKQLSKGPPQLVSRIVRSSEKGQKKIRSLLKR